jgi:hypothetical protein
MHFYPSLKTSDMYFSLPLWCQEEMRTCETGFIYSGFASLGWSWNSKIYRENHQYSLSAVYTANGTHPPSLLGSLSEASSCILPSEPSFYLPFYEELLSGIQEDFVLSDSSSESSAVELKLSFSFRGEEEVLLGSGDDRLEAMVSLLSSICSFYMIAFRPSLGDASSARFLDPYRNYNLLAGPIGGAVPSSMKSVDIIEDRDGVMSLNFSSYQSAVEFINHYKRFLSPSKLRDDCKEDFFGTMLMMEGEIRVYSCYGEDKIPTTLSDILSVSPGYLSVSSGQGLLTKLQNAIYTTSSSSMASSILPIASLPVTSASYYTSFSGVDISESFNKKKNPVGTGRLKMSKPIK